MDQLLWWLGHLITKHCLQLCGDKPNTSDGIWRHTCPMNLGTSVMTNFGVVLVGNVIFCYLYITIFSFLGSTLITIIVISSHVRTITRTLSLFQQWLSALQVHCRPTMKLMGWQPLLSDRQYNMSALYNHITVVLMSWICIISINFTCIIRSVRCEWSLYVVLVCWHHQ